MSAFAQAVVRSVRGSLGRFLAIMGIAALGCGFFAGLRMEGPDMRAAADAWYDRTGLCDLRVVSTQGLGEKDLGRLAAVDGVAAVSGVTSVDAMVRVGGGEQVAARVQTLPTAYETGGEPALDRLDLVDGRWPDAPGECVASADNPTLEVGVGDAIEVLSESGDQGLLAAHELTVVGLVSSSAYPYTVSFGSTTLASGQVDQYLYVADGTFAADAPYTEARLAVAGAADEQSGGERYQQVVGDVRAAIEGHADELAEARLADVRADAQAEVDDARADYEAERADAEARLAETASELDAAADQIAVGQARVDAGAAALARARTELGARRADAETELTAAQGRLDQAQAQVDASVAQLDASAADAEAARAACEQGTTALLAQLAAQGVAANDLAGARSGIETALDALPEDDPTTTALSAALEQVAQLEAARDAADAYDAGRAQAAEAQAQVDAGRAELAQRRADSEAQLAAAQGEIDGQAAQLDAAAAELADARASYESGRAAYEDACAEADARLADAAARIDDAQAEVDALEPGELYVLDRAQSEGAATYQADSERMDTIATVFPLVFFLVAALVSLTTMTRMVDDERTQIGLYKALGYSTARIAGRYLAYAALASATGAALGIAALAQVLPSVIMSAYGIIYAVPRLALPLPVDPAVALTSGGLGVGVTLAATWAAVVAALRETSAALMQPRAPKAGRRILLERVRPLWRRLSFSWKVTCRNLFRYKKRLLMTVTGVAGCAALLLVGFGLHDAIWDILDRQFGPIAHYDTTVSLGADATAVDADEACGLIEASGGDVLARVQVANAQVSAGDAGSALAVQLVVPQDADALDDAVSLRERVSQEEVALPPDGLVLAEKIADRLGVGVGDAVTLYGQDAVGNVVGEGRALTVTGVCENYVGSVAYVGAEAWAELAAAGVTDEAAPVFSTIYADTAGASRDALTDELEADPSVQTVAFTDDAVQSYRTMLSAVDLIVVVLIVSAAALAFIVLYNLTNINIVERVREIASLKVLGFRRGEVHAYVFREVALISALGAAVGMVLGTWLEGYVIQTAEVDVVMFGRQIHPLSYAAALALTMAFSGLVMLAMRRRLDRVDMVESLKSVE
ncbi:FtsX-like permease family protein [Thermophilibacter sp.]